MTYFFMPVESCWRSSFAVNCKDALVPSEGNGFVGSRWHTIIERGGSDEIIRTKRKAENSGNHKGFLGRITVLI
jgi:hypothetical protein